MPIQTVSQAFTNEGVGGFSFRNKIINGAMEIDQRNAGASVSVGNTYTLDRWQARTTTGSGHTVIQSSTVPTGFSKSLLFTVGTGASQGSTDQNRLFHYIEGSNLFDLQWGTSAAKTVTLSFWVRSSLTGTFGGSLINNAFDRSYPFSYSISAANTWEYKTITIAGDTSGTWTMGNSIGVAVCWNLGSGTSKVTTAGSWASGEYLGSTGNTVITATSGATWAITGAQFEIGSVATPFERRPYGMELELCQRYYWSNPNTYFYYKARELDRNRVATVPFPVQMRAAPTITKISDPSGFTWTWGTPSVNSVPGNGTAPSDGYVDYTGVMAASAEL